MKTGWRWIVEGTPPGGRSCALGLLAALQLASLPPQTFQIFVQLVPPFLQLFRLSDSLVCRALDVGETILARLERVISIAAGPFWFRIHESAFPLRQWTLISSLKSIRLVGRLP